MDFYFLGSKWYCSARLNNLLLQFNRVTIQSERRRLTRCKECKCPGPQHRISTASREARRNANAWCAHDTNEQPNTFVEGITEHWQLRHESAAKLYSSADADDDEEQVDVDVSRGRLS